MKGLESYRFGAKNNWRRWAWNQIEKRVRSVGVLPRDAVGLYLPGPTDIDLIVAESKGFKARNAIAVEADRTRYEFLRGSRPAIHGSLLAAIRAWSSSEPVDFVLADLCCPFTDDVRTLTVLCATVSDHGAACVLNVMRGREQGEALSDLRTFKRLSGNKPHDQSLHRGAVAFSSAIYGWLGRCSDADPNAPNSDRIVDLVERTCKPEYRSYRSRMTTMDSIAFTGFPVGDATFPFGIRRKAHRLPLRFVRHVAAVKAIRARTIPGVA